MIAFVEGGTGEGGSILHDSTDRGDLARRIARWLLNHPDLLIELRLVLHLDLGNLRVHLLQLRIGAGQQLCVRRLLRRKFRRQPVDLIAGVAGPADLSIAGRGGPVELARSNDRM